MCMRLGAFELTCFDRSAWRDGKICWQKPGAEWASFLAVNLVMEYQSMVRCKMVPRLIPFPSFWVLCVAGAFEKKRRKSETKSYCANPRPFVVILYRFWSLGKNPYHITIHRPFVIVLWNRLWRCNPWYLAWHYNKHSTALWCHDCRGWEKNWPDVRWSGPTARRHYVGWWCIWMTPVSPVLYKSAKENKARHPSSPCCRIERWWKM